MRIDCSDCEFWAYSYPHIAGVCTVGPREIEGRRMPMTAEVVGQALADEHDGCTTATLATTTCAMWEPKDLDTYHAYMESLDESLPYESTAEVEEPPEGEAGQEEGVPGV